jgi:hypothetical protein
MLSLMRTPLATLTAFNIPLPRRQDSPHPLFALLATSHLTSQHTAFLAKRQMKRAFEGSS